MRVGLDQLDGETIPYLLSPRLRESHIKSLIAAQAIDHWRLMARQRKFVRLVSDCQTGVIGDVFIERQLTVQVTATYRHEPVVFGHKRLRYGGKSGVVVCRPPTTQITLALLFCTLILANVS